MNIVPRMTPHLPSKRKGDIRAIFVHAGAGFHSIGNERLHLKACEDACKAAMAILKEGGTAVDAVEMAVKILEDREITNAGYGSNLALDGVVECDAIVVDHFGRSGAAGAVAQIKNPISLARLILDRSSKPLLLRRVPPNLLCGEGATRWAYEQGMEILPHEGLVSPAAQERWQKWVEDLNAAERKQRRHDGSPMPPRNLLTQDRTRATHRRKMLLPRTDSRLASPATTGGSRSGASTHSSPSMTATSSCTTPDDDLRLTRNDRIMPDASTCELEQASRNPLMNSTQKVPTLYDVADISDSAAEVLQDAQGANDQEVDMVDVDDQVPEEWTRHPPRRNSWRDGSSEDSEGQTSSRSTLRLPSLTPSPPDNTPAEPDTALDHPICALPNAAPEDLPQGLQRPMESPGASGTEATEQSRGQSDPKNSEDDLITDTVGAVAIDVYGNIAAAASSGGIGMKHPGRVGPAALIGVGACVIPSQSSDPDRMCIATVTSGTGEHMATTLAAQTCSERVYHGLKKGPSAALRPAEHEDDAVRSFIEHDFMGHPSVRHSISAGAIGVLTIKKTKDGAYMYFAHNTDSFALASMHANEAKPVVCMSRSAGNGDIAQGGRGMRFRRSRQ